MKVTMRLQQYNSLCSSYSIVATDQSKSARTTTAITFRESVKTVKTAAKVVSTFISSQQLQRIIPLQTIKNVKSRKNIIKRKNIALKFIIECMRKLTIETYEKVHNQYQRDFKRIYDRFHHTNLLTGHEQIKSLFNQLCRKVSEKLHETSFLFQNQFVHQVFTTDIVFRSFVYADYKEMFALISDERKRMKYLKSKFNLNNN